MKLYEFSTSRSIRIHWILNELDIDCETHSLDFQNGENQSEEYLKIHPLGKVPALVDGELTLWESAAIINYLAEKYPKANLIPESGTSERALYDQWMSYALTELDAVLWTKMKHKFALPEEYRTADVNPACDFEFKRNAQVFEKYLENHSYALGDNFQAVDILIGQIFYWAQKIKMLNDLPNCEAYLDKLKQRSAFPKQLRN